MTYDTDLDRRNINNPFFFVCTVGGRATLGLMTRGRACTAVCVISASRPLQPDPTDTEIARSSFQSFFGGKVVETRVVELCSILTKTLNVDI